MLLMWRLRMIELRGCSRAGRKWAGLGLATLREAVPWRRGTGLHAQGSAMHGMWRGNSVSHAAVCECVHFGVV